MLALALSALALVASALATPAPALVPRTLVPRADVPLLNQSGTVVAPAINATFHFDGRLFNFTYNGIGGTDYHTTGVQVQIVTQGMGQGVRASGLPPIVNGYARTTKATVANIRPNAFQANSTDFELTQGLLNRYEYSLRLPVIPQWQVDLPGTLVIIEFYTTPDDHGLTWTNVHYHPLKFVSSKPL